MPDSTTAGGPRAGTFSRLALCMGDEAVSTRLDPSHSDTCRIGGATAPLKVPTSDRGVIRTVRDFRSDILKATEQGWRRHGDIVRYRLGPVSVYCISDSELAHEVFVNPLLYGKLGATTLCDWFSAPGCSPRPTTRSGSATAG